MKAQVCIDWCSFTVKSDDPIQVINDILLMDSNLFQPAPGLFRYTDSYSFHSIRVCYNVNKNRQDLDDPFCDMGVYVSMSGEGCKAFSEFSKHSDFPTFFLFASTYKQASINFTRIDIACDDKSGLLRMDRIFEYIEEDKVNCRSSSRSLIQSRKNKDISGATAYIGSPSSDFRMRFYDKAAEQGVPGPWVRCEMVFRREHANALVSALCLSSSIGQLASQVLNDKFAFIERTSINITYCQHATWWDQFVDEICAVHLVSSERMIHPIIHIQSWFEQSIGPTFALLLNIFGPEVLRSIASRAWQRLSFQKQALWADYLKSCIDDLSSYDLGCLA